MVRYIVKPRVDDRLAEEPAGLESAHLEAARAKVLAAARSLLVEKAWAGKMLEGEQYELWDDVGRLLATIWISGDKPPAEAKPGRGHPLRT